MGKGCNNITFSAIIVKKNVIIVKGMKRIYPFYSCFFFCNFESYLERQSYWKPRAKNTTRKVGDQSGSGSECTKPTPRAICASSPQTLFKIDNNRVVAQNPLLGYLLPQLQIYHVLYIKSCQGLGRLIHCLTLVHARYNVLFRLLIAIALINKTILKKKKKKNFSTIFTRVLVNRIIK